MLTACVPGLAAWRRPPPLPTRALGLLESAGTGFRQLGDWKQAAQCAHLRALVLDALGRQEGRDAAAAEACALQAQRGEALGD